MEKLLSHYFKSESVIKCEKCGEDYPESMITLVESMTWICDDCLDEHAKNCSICKEWIFNENTEQNVNNDVICDWCSKEIKEAL